MSLAQIEAYRALTYEVHLEGCARCDLSQHILRDQDSRLNETVIGIVGMRLDNGRESPWTAVKDYLVYLATKLPNDGLQPLLP